MHSIKQQFLCLLSDGDNKWKTRHFDFCIEIGSYFDRFDIKLQQTSIKLIIQNQQTNMPTQDINIWFDHAYCTHQNLAPFKMTPYASIRNGINKVRTKTVEGNKPSFKEEHTLSVDLNDPVLTIKIKDRNTTLPFVSGAINQSIGERKINIKDLGILQDRVFEDYVSLEHKNYPAGKIFLKIYVPKK